MNFNKFVIERKIKDFLCEDCRFNDVSSEVIPSDSNVKAKIVAKSEGYISGLEEIKVLFNLLNVKIDNVKKDGDKILSYDVISHLEGRARDILVGERTALNILTIMSNITTTTRKYVDIINEINSKTRIACTRKTTPGFRIFEKRAVELGGGDTHRYSLDDMILLKDTHIKFYEGDIQKILNEAKKKGSFSKKIEIEIEKPEDIKIATESGADIIMLDNMTPNEVKQAIELIEKLDLRDKIVIEVSGGITLNNFRSYLEVQPDIISSSEITLTPSEKVDLSLEFL